MGWYNPLPIGQEDGLDGRNRHECLGGSRKKVQPTIQEAWGHSSTILGPRATQNPLQLPTPPNAVAHPQNMRSSQNTRFSNVSTARVFLFPPPAPHATRSAPIVSRDTPVPTISSDKGSNALITNTSDCGNRILGKLGKRRVTLCIR